MHLHLNKWSIVLIYPLSIAIQSDENHSPLNKDPFFLNDHKHIGTEYLVLSNICTEWCKLFRFHVLWDNLDG